jgi:glycosyltransferase involved in cell wall biosynthesis
MRNDADRNTQRIGFVSSRICGTDGVSLEVGKWSDILERMGYECYFIAGECDRVSERQFVIPEADFRHPAVQEINDRCFGHTHRDTEISDLIRTTAASIKKQLYTAIEQFGIDLVVAENALTIPLNIPLGAALEEVIAETRIPCIAHHHDFVWERERFVLNCVHDYISALFPPRNPELEHVVINSVAGAEFARRTGLSYRVIPNVMDFEQPPQPGDDYASDFRQELGVSDDDILILQPTRVVQRKGIEHSIELVRRLDDPRCKLLITHDHEDEGREYLERIRWFAKLLGVEILLASDRIGDRRGTTSDGRKRYAIWDVYPHADLVTYPSTYEGFGNAFLEAVYYRKPIFCNRYTTYRTDIEPFGFQAIAMNGYLTHDIVDEVRRALTDDSHRQQMVDHNYEVGRKFFSYDRVENELRSMLATRWQAPYA